MMMVDVTDDGERGSDVDEFASEEDISWTTVNHNDTNLK